MRQNEFIVSLRLLQEAGYALAPLARSLSGETAVAARRVWKDLAPEVDAARWIHGDGRLSAALARRAEDDPAFAALSAETARRVQAVYDLVASATRAALQRREASPSADLPEPSASAEEKRENADRMALHVVRGEAVIESYPVRVLVDANNRCNYRCRTCYQSADQSFPVYDVSEVPIERLAAPARFARDFHLGGTGEPLLSAAAARVMALYKAAGASVEFVTNGSMPRRLKEAAAVADTIFLSFDGGTRETFELVRQGADFDRVLAGLRQLPPEDRCKIRLNYVVCRQTVREIFDVLEIAGRLQLGEVALQQFHPYLSEHDRMTLLSEDVEWLREVLPAWRERAAELGVGSQVQLVLETGHATAGGSRTLPPPPAPREARRLALEEALRELAAAAIPDVRSWREIAGDVAEPEPPAGRNSRRLPYCLAPWTHAVFAGDGSLKPCCVLRSRSAATSDGDFEGDWFGPEMTRLRALMVAGRPPNPGCVGCREPLRFSGLGEILQAAVRTGVALEEISLPADFKPTEEIASDPLVRRLQSAQS